MNRPEDRYAAILQLRKSLPATSNPNCETFESNYVGATKSPVNCDRPNCPTCRSK